MAMDFDTLVAALVSAVRECQEQDLILNPEEQGRVVDALESIAGSLGSLVEIAAALEATR